MPYTPLRRPAIILALAAAITGFPGMAIARSSDRPSQATPSSFIGQWELDLTRMPSTYGSPPKRVVYEFKDIGSGKYRLTVDITGQDDSIRHMAVSYRPDGTTFPSEAGADEADSAAVMTSTRNVLVLNLGRAKMLGSVRVYIVSKDGREMTESAAGITGDGQPFVRNFHYKRLR